MKFLMDYTIRRRNGTSYPLQLMFESPAKPVTVTVDGKSVWKFFDSKVFVVKVAGVRYMRAIDTYKAERL